MKKIIFSFFLLTSGLAQSSPAMSQKAPVEIQKVPPAVQSEWLYHMGTTYNTLYGRWDFNTWYMDKGLFVSKTVFRYTSYFITLTMLYTPQGELIDAYTDQ